MESVEHLPVIQLVNTSRDSRQSTAEGDDMSRRRPPTESEYDIAALREATQGLALAATELIKTHSLIQAQTAPAQNISSRSADTLRRDIGILAILLAMAAQTGMGFYWAGGVSRSNDATQKEIEKVSAEQAYQRAQLQLLDGQLKEMKGRQEERERQSNRK